MAQNSGFGKCKIDDVRVTSDTLTSRAGLALFVRYLENIVIFPYLVRLFGGIRKSRKGQKVEEIFKQLFCFLVDGTSNHLSYFDVLQGDEGYAAALESRPDQLLSRAAVARFCKAFSWYRIWLFRRLLQRLFVWRLKLEKPELIELGIDTMIMDNNHARKRHGVEPTYKRVRGFQPLQMTWGRFIVDAVFRGGSKHSNHSDTVEKMVRHVVHRIRSDYRSDVLIVVRVDAGFFDQKLFGFFEELQIGYICSGRLYEDIKEFTAATERIHWKRLTKGKRIWQYMEFGSRRGSWDHFRKAIFCRPMEANGQLLLPFVRPERVLYTNLGMGGVLDERFRKAGMEDYLSTESVVATAHGRGADELVHRALKEFASERLPFKRFQANAALYYIILTAFFLYECFKEDVCAPVVPVTSYPTALRRKIIDIAGKVVRTGGKIILKITETAWRTLRFDALWNRCAHVPTFC